MYNHPYILMKQAGILDMAKGLGMGAFNTAKRDPMAATAFGITAPMQKMPWEPAPDLRIKTQPENQ